jgi:hypothetical protein
MSRNNTGWGAPRIHCELKMSGIGVSDSTVAKYMVRHRKPPSQTWRTFLDNHVSELASVDFFTGAPAAVPTATFRSLAVFDTIPARFVPASWTVTACVWSASTAKRPQIDHCFPWVRWLNNDLWNLMPANAAVNFSKGDKLPSALAMSDAKHRITDWWQRTYIDLPLRERFIMEARTSLPRLMEGEPGLGDLYQAMLHQRAPLKADQKLVEWTLR